jgi:hypothetical protein
MYKTLIFVAFLVASIVTAALFGAIHDQISFMVSSEYYTRFKFIQFHLADSPLPDRLRVAMVGILASWWMGVPLGVLCGAAGFFQHTPVLMGRALAWSLLLAVAFTFTIAIFGLAYSRLQTENVALADYHGWYVPAGITDLRSFLCAGYMHNSAYLGGTIAVPVVWAFLVWYRAVTKKSVYPTGQP